jgi:hypothetical protein
LSGDDGLDADDGSPVHPSLMTVALQGLSLWRGNEQSSPTRVGWRLLAIFMTPSAHPVNTVQDAYRFTLSKLYCNELYLRGGLG